MILDFFVGNYLNLIEFYIIYFGRIYFLWVEKYIMLRMILFIVFRKNVFKLYKELLLWIKVVFKIVILKNKNEV